MPPLPVITDVFRCAFNWHSATAGHATNVIHIRAPDSDESDVFTHITSNMTRDMWNPVSLQAFVDNIVITPLDGTSASAVHTVTTNNQGEGNNQAMPAVAAIVKLETGIRGKSHRGRVYLPFVAEDQADSGRLGSAQQATTQAAWQDFLDGIAGEGDNIVVASYKLESADFVTSLTVEGALGTQRRRQSRLRP